MVSVPDAAPTTAGGGSSPAEIRRVTWSSYLGNTIEYYDFILYGSAAAVVFGPLFFSELSPTLATLASFATLATGYISRPLGGLVLGNLGDRIGRKKVLLLTMVLMGLASGLIGLLPTYAQAGVLAPILLVVLRLVQGFSVGGEWGGAALLAAEHAPPARRGFYTAIGQAGLPTGGLLSTVALALVSALPDEDLLTWGWRIPFLLSFALLGVGLYMRLRIAESPLFDEMEEAAEAKKAPLVEVLRMPRPLLRGIGASLPGVVISSLYGSFAVSYAVGLGVSRSVTLVALSIAWAASIATMPFYGMLSDRIGRRPMFTAGSLGFAVLTWPAFWALGSGSALLVVVAFVVIFALVSVAMSASLAALLSELFPTAVRYSGVSTAYQVGTLVGGFTPLAAGGLLALGGGGRNIEWIVAFAAVIGVVAAAAVWFGRESRGSDLRELDRVMINAAGTRSGRSAPPGSDPSEPAGSRGSVR